MISENILRIKKRIETICAKLNRDAAQVRIVAVTKGRTAFQIEEVIKAGLTDIGENRVQEAFTKYKELLTMDYGLLTIKWHMIGHLQTNKVKDAVRIFDLIHSVDSLRLAAEINKEAQKADKIQEILVEVNIAKDPAKFGFKPEVSEDAIKEISVFENIRIKGLMTIAPAVDNPEKTRQYFRELKKIFDNINQLPITNHQFEFLSMGMSDDFAVAIEEGSNMIRLGRVIFEGENV